MPNPIKRLKRWFVYRSSETGRFIPKWLFNLLPKAETEKEERRK